MKQQYSIKWRPRRFSQLIGADESVSFIRRMYKKLHPKVWLFSGDNGSGKTTLGKIVALSLQCRHQTKFGEPCKECYRNRKGFDITEINCANKRQVEKIETSIEGCYYVPKSGSKFRVYILDEPQMLSYHAQNFLQKPMEDESASTSMFILCTTDPDALIRGIRRRAIVHQIPSLSIDGVRDLVKKLLVKEGSELDPGTLSDALNENKITSPGFVVQAITKYLVGEPPEKAILVESSTEFDTHRLCRSLTKGAWDDVRKQLDSAQPTDALTIRRSVVGYLRQIILNSEEIDDRTKAVGDAIKVLGSLPNIEHSVLLGVVCAALFDVTRIFSRYRH